MISLIKNLQSIAADIVKRTNQCKASQSFNNEHMHVFNMDGIKPYKTLFISFELPAHFMCTRKMSQANTNTFKYAVDMQLL